MPFLDCRSSPGHLVHLLVDGLEGLAPSLGVRIPLVTLPECARVLDIRNFLGGEIPPAFERGFAVERRWFCWARSGGIFRKVGIIGFRVGAFQQKWFEGHLNMSGSGGKFWLAVGVEVRVFQSDGVAESFHICTGPISCSSFIRGL